MNSYRSVAAAPNESVTPGSPPGFDRGQGVQLTCDDPIMRPVLEAIATAAATPAPVIIIGEMGCGKKVVAHAVHAASRRSAAPYVIVGRGQNDSQVQINELLSAFKHAANGTLVIDGIDELPPALQSKLVAKLDGLHGDLPDLRLITTTRVEPKELLRTARLRQELYLHLAVVPIRIPPLRERRHDLPVLAQEILDQISSRWGLPRPQLSEPAARSLLSANWPGNVRELRNALQLATALAADGMILPEHLDLDAFNNCGSQLTLAETERDAILRALANVSGHRRKAAANLGIGLRTLYDKIKRYQIG